MTQNRQKTTIERVLLDVLAFGIGLSCAYFLKWKTTDLVWSLWLSSLVVGYLTILSILGCGAVFGTALIRHRDLGKQRLPAILGGIALGAWFLGLYTFVFCGFHAGHSVFLQGFFPLKGLPEDGFGDAFANPPLLWVLVFRHLMKLYGLFLIAIIIAERRGVFSYLPAALKSTAHIKTAGELDELLGSRKSASQFGNAMVRPFVNVVRMHLLIFFFAICAALKVHSFLVFAVVYAVYFFPWSELKKVDDNKIGS